MFELIQELDLFWGLWLLAFIIWEVITLFNKKKGDTLSENVRRLFAIKGFQYHEFKKIRRVGLLTLLSWMLVHFFFPGFM